MARPVDEKIVRMKMENSTFKEKVTETVGYFSKLTKGLEKLSTKSDLSKTTKEFDKISNTAKNVNLDNLIAAVDNVRYRFSLMGMVAMTTIQNITNRAVNMGIALGRSVTIQPVKDGFEEYELKMKSIQTILSNTRDKGTKMSEITKVLDELNTYADKTIYNFAEMTYNIGTFTAAGVGLKDSAVAIKGIANLAAASGSNAQQASTAMYQLSQALASGFVGLQDWNSVVNANMGGQLFQKALIKTAKEINNVDVNAKNFRDSLKSGWLTSEVLIKTLDKFSKDKSMLEAATKVRTFTQLVDTAKEALGSGWTNTWEYLIGDFEQAGVMWTNANNAIDALVSKSADARNDLVKSFVKLGGRDAIINSIANSFKAIVQYTSLAKQGVEKIFPPMTAKRLYEMVAAIESFTKGLRLSKEDGAKFSQVFEGIAAAAQIVIKVIKMVTKAIVDMVPEGTGGRLLDIATDIAQWVISLNDALKPMNTFSELLGVIAEKARGVFDFLLNAVHGFTSNIGQVGSVFTSVFKSIGSVIKDVTGAATKSLKGLDINDLLMGGGLVAVITFITKLRDEVGNLFETFNGVGETVNKFSKVFDLIDGLTETLESMQKVVNVASIVAIAGAVLMLAIALDKMSSIDAKDIFKGLEVLALALAGVMRALWFLNKKNLTGSFKATSTIMGIASALLIMSASLKVLSTINPDEMGTALLGLGASLAVIVAGLAAMSKLKGGTLNSATSLNLIATSMVILAGAMKILSTISVDDSIKSVATIAGLLTTFALFSQALRGSKIGITTATSVLVISGALVIMSQAIKLLGNIDVDVLKQGLISMAVILGEMAIFSKIVSGSKLTVASVGFTVMALALTEMLIPLKVLGDMDTGKLVQSLLGLTGVLVMFASASKLIGAKGFVSAAVMGAMALAINALVIPLKVLGTMSLAQLGMSLLAIGSAFTVVAIAAALLGPIAVGPLLAFSAAMLSISLTLGTATVIVVAMVAAITSLATLGVAGITAFVASVGVLIAGLTMLIPVAVDFIVKLVVEMTKGLIKMAPVLLDGLCQIVVAALEALNKYLPRAIVVGVELVTNLIDGLEQTTGPMVESAVSLIITLIDSLANTVRDEGPRFVKAIMNLLESVLELLVDTMVELVDVLFGWIPKVSDVSKDIGEEAKRALRESFNIEDAKKIGSGGGRSFADGIASTKIDVNKTAEELTKGITETYNLDLSPQGQKGGETFNSGIEKTKGAAKTTANGVASNAKSGLSVDTMASGLHFGSGFSIGISNSAESVNASARRLAQGANTAFNKELDIRSPSRKTMKSGKFFVQGFTKGTNKESKNATKAVKKVALTATQEFNKALSSKKSQLSAGKINMKEYKASLTKMRKEYIKHSSIVKKIDIEMKAANKDSSKYKQTIQKEEAAFIKKGFDKQKEAIDEKKYYGKMSLQQELKAWQLIQKKYKKGTSERKEADREVYRLKNAIIEDGFNKEKARIEERLYFGKMSLKQEYNAWLAIQKKYKKGTEQRKEADREVYRLKNELDKKAFEDSKANIENKKYYNKLSVFQEYEAWVKIQKKYKAGTDERKEADREVYRLKNEINQQLKALEEDYLAKTKEVNEQLKADIASVNEEYEQAVRDRASTISNFTSLFDKVSGLVKISGDELKRNLQGQVDTIQRWKDQVAILASKGIDEALLDEIRQMGPSAVGQIEGLNQLTSYELDQYVALWQQKNQLAKEQATLELQGMRENADKLIEEMTEDAKKQLDTYKAEWLKQINVISKGVKDEYVKLNTSMKTIGKNTISGLMQGMSDMTPSLLAQAQSIANSIASTINQALKIKSPSRRTKWSGNMVDEGLISGMKEGERGVVNQARSLSESVADTIDEMMEGIESDNTVYINAVVEYDDDELKSLDQITSSISVGGNYANQLVDSIVSRIAKESPPTQNNQNGDKQTSFNPTFNIDASPKSKEIARAAERNMRKYAFMYGV